MRLISENSGVASAVNGFIPVIAIAVASGVEGAGAVFTTPTIDGAGSDDAA